MPRAERQPEPLGNATVRASRILIPTARERARMHLPAVVAKLHALRRVVFSAYGLSESRQARAAEAPTDPSLLEDVFALLLADALDYLATTEKPPRRTMTSLAEGTQHRPRLVRDALPNLVASGVQRSGGVRGDYYALPQVHALTPDGRARIVHALDDLLDEDLGEDDDARKFRALLQLTRQGLLGEWDLAQMEAQAPGVWNTLARAYRKQATAALPLALRRWNEADWRFPCRHPMRDGAACILPLHHRMGHHSPELGLHHVEHDGTREDAGRLLCELSILTHGDALVWLDGFESGQHYRMMRLGGIPEADAVKLREIIDLALHEGWLHEGAASTRTRVRRRAWGFLDAAPRPEDAQA